MQIEINGNTIRLTGKNKKAIQIYHNEEDDIFTMSICQNGIEYGSLPMITFCKNHTICHNTLSQGKSFIN